MIEEIFCVKVKMWKVFLYSCVVFMFLVCCDIIFIWWLLDCIIFGDCFGYFYS